MRCLRTIPPTRWLRKRCERRCRARLRRRTRWQAEAILRTAAKSPVGRFRVLVAARAPRRNVRRTRAQACGPGSKDPPEPEPPRAASTLARLRRAVRRRLEGSRRTFTGHDQGKPSELLPGRRAGARRAPLRGVLRRPQGGGRARVPRSIRARMDIEIVNDGPVTIVLGT